jgi:exosortase
MSLKTPFYQNNLQICSRFGVIIILISILYYKVFKGLINDWIHLPDFSHGFIIPLISLYLIWQSLDSLQNIPAKPNNLGVLVTIGGLSLLIVGNLAGENFAMRVSFLVVISGTVLFHFGEQHLKILLFPIAYLLFMFPIPSILLERITFPMQLFASKVATSSLQMAQIPVLREGNVIHLANTSLQVVEACSGIRSLISLLAIGTIFAYFSQKILWKRITLVIMCFPIAIFVNSLRVSITGLLTHYYSESIAQGFFHGFSGYILFIVSFASMFLTGLILSRIPDQYRFSKNNS